MLQPEEQLRKLSFDSDLQLVLRTPNRINYKPNDFEAWEDRPQHPLDSPQRKLIHNSHKPQFKIKPSKIKINPQSLLKNNHQMIQNKENNSHQTFFNLQLVQNTNKQTLSPNSRKLLTPTKAKLTDQLASSLYTRNRFYQTPKTTNRTRQNSFTKLSMTQALINQISYSQKRDKYLANQENIDDCDQNGYKIPLSAIVYPLLRANNKKNPRRIDRFHSFVARTVRK